MLAALWIAAVLTIPVFSSETFECAVHPTGGSVHSSRSATSPRRGRLPGGTVVRASNCLEGWCVVRATLGSQTVKGWMEQAALMEVAEAKAAIASPVSSGRLAQPAMPHHAGELGFKDGDEALAICSGALVSTRVKVTTVEDAVLDHEGQKTGQEARADACANASWVIGTPRLRPAIIFTATVVGDVSHKGATIALGARVHKLYSRKDGKDAVLVLNGQEIARVEAKTMPYFGVRWAGDLDRDGALDLIVDLSTGENASEPSLFLSSAGPAGKPAIVASQRTTGC